VSATPGVLEENDSTNGCFWQEGQNSFDRSCFALTSTWRIYSPRIDQLSTTKKHPAGSMCGGAQPILNTHKRLRGKLDWVVFQGKFLPAPADHWLQPEPQGSGWGILSDNIFG
jgi:hypothetical protein